MALLLAITAIIFVNIQAQPTASTEISQVLTKYTNTASLPDDTGWHGTSLPDDWFRKSNNKQFKWYRFQLAVADINQNPLGIYVTNASRPITFFINGIQLPAHNSISETVPRIWSHPQFSIYNLLDHSSPFVEVTLRIPSNQSQSGLLGKIYTGDKKEIIKDFESAFFIKARLPWLTLYAMFLSGVLMAALWMLRRKDSIYGYYSLGAFTWVMYSFQYVPSSIPISDYIWELIGMNAMFWFPIVTALFCNNYLKSPHPRMERLILFAGISLSIITLLVNRMTFYWMADYLLPVAAFILGVYPMGRMLIETFRRRDSRLTWLTILAGALTDLLLLNDVLVLGHWIPPWSGLFFHYAALPLICIVFSILLLERFVDTLNEAETLNISLENRVREKTNELESNHLRLRKLEREQYLADERERIMRDMHDGVGGALLSMRAALERDEWNRNDIHTGVCEALDDLYLMIHSLDPYDEDLGMALGATRHRFERRLKQAGLKLGWHLNEIPPIKGLGPQVVLQVIRIIQEAINNVIKHSSATQVNIQVSCIENSPKEAPCIRIEIIDNGTGLSNSESTGFGLRNMKQRAKSISAHISIHSDDSGTVVQLDLPSELPAYQINTSAHH